MKKAIEKFDTLDEVMIYFTSMLIQMNLYILPHEMLGEYICPPGPLSYRDGK